jgi:prevent-host-death family protein
MDWQLAEAKNQLSEVVTLALTDGPQRIRRRNQSVVILSEVEYQRLSCISPRFKDYLMQAPSFEGVNVKRDESISRDVGL